MSGNIDNKKVMTAICILLAFVSVFIMLYQIKIYKAFVSYSVEAKAPVSVSWVETSGAVTVPVTDTENATVKGETYVINTKTGKIHRPDCSYAVNMNESNKQVIVTDNINEYYLNGYTSCSKCLP